MSHFFRHINHFRSNPPKLKHSHLISTKMSEKKQHEEKSKDGTELNSDVNKFSAKSFDDVLEAVGTTSWINIVIILGCCSCE